MEKCEGTDAYYARERTFKNEINLLRKIALKTEALETLKWGMPVYTINNKNVFGISAFKQHYGIWFYNGVFLSDPNKVLTNAQEGKTKGMRQWKLDHTAQIDEVAILGYMNEAIQNQKEGKVMTVAKKSTKIEIPELLANALKSDAQLKTSFSKFSPYKQKEFSEYIMEAKQEKTKLKRLEKIIPMIKDGIGLNDAYRK